MPLHCSDNIVMIYEEPRKGELGNFLINQKPRMEFYSIQCRLEPPRMKQVCQMIS